MNKILALSVAAGLLAGCASHQLHFEFQPQPMVISSAGADPKPAPPPGQSDIIRQAAAQPPQPVSGDGWRAMFDGQSLTGWRETPFAGRGGVQVESGLIRLGMGDPFTGITWTNDFPKLNYEIALEALRVSGSDFFCGLTVPVRDSFCSLIVGGWGGSLVGISSLDSMDASENETTRFRSFETGRWYRIRLRVTADRLEAWIDSDKVVDVDTQGRRLSLRPGDIELAVPLGVSCWQTAAAVRDIKWRPVSGPEGAPK